MKHTVVCIRTACLCRLRMAKYLEIQLRIVGGVAVASFV